MDRRFGRPLPCQLANPTRAHPIPPEFFTPYHAVLCAYAVLAAVSSCYPPVWGRLPTRYSPVRRSVTKTSIRRNPFKRFARLACVKHAASVHPEPGSNSLKIRFSPSQNQPFLANPSLVYCFRFVQKMFLIRTFEDVFYCSVVKFLCCLSSEATLTIYHNYFCLSTTFFISLLLSHATACLYYHSFLRLSTAFFISFHRISPALFLFLNAFLHSEQTEKEGFEPSRRYKRPTPLAGAPLQPLEYFSNA